MSTEWARGFALRLKQARKAAEFTQDDLAHAMGLNRSSIANVEGARQRMSAHQVVVVSEILCCDPGWLLTGENGRPPLPFSRLAVTDLVTDMQTMAQRITDAADDLTILADAVRPSPNAAA